MFDNEYLTFEERRRARYLRRGIRRAREEAMERVLGALAVVVPVALGWLACAAISAAHCWGVM